MPDEERVLPFLRGGRKERLLKEEVAAGPSLENYDDDEDLSDFSAWE